ncbi:hypothetical protein CPB85DRAFT_555519 [Mucidula mucida]|nr:hypothetical protein CPB85DRAFT_555519 [Mucidula mucida]
MARHSTLKLHLLASRGLMETRVPQSPNPTPPRPSCSAPDKPSTPPTSWWVLNRYSTLIQNLLDLPPHPASYYLISLATLLLPRRLISVTSSQWRATNSHSCLADPLTLNSAHLDPRAVSANTYVAESEKALSRHYYDIPGNGKLNADDVVRWKQEDMSSVLHSVRMQT